ncbi:uncharacterized protein UHOD_03306 [Ustilago sp. UG-2017b]|nr:uncharacterized protein UHOD_03306 [Ustilago sp. UG-2017b]
MQSQHDNAQQCRSSTAHSHQPTSSSSIAPPPDPSQAFDPQQQQPRHQEQQNEAQASMQRRPSQTAASQLTKLDGVIYHFYTTTANLIIQSRLAHLRPLLLATPPFDASPTEQRPTSAAGSSSQTKLSRWFGLHIPDSDLFKEELRFWRSVTSLVGIDSLDDESLSRLSEVPDLLVDVLLDLSTVSERHEILVLTKPSPPGSTRFSQSHASSSRICIDGRRPGEPASSPSSPRPQRIVLERWRLCFQSTQPSDPPDLSTFYKRSVLHFRALFTLLCSLPANHLSAKIEALKASADDHSKISHPSHPSLAAREDMGSYDAEMTVGCRLDMASPEAEQKQSALPDEVSVSHALPAEGDLSFFKHNEADPINDGQYTSHGHYATRTLPPIATPISYLELSVTYRKLTGFSIEDAESLRNANDIKVDLDEDYFRTTHPAERIPSELSKPPTISAASPPGTEVQPASEDRTTQPTKSPIPAPVQQRIGGISAARPATLAAQRYSPDVTPASTEAMLSQSPASTSVFSTSASGRHSAGLSSFRRASSTKSNVSLMSPATTSAAPSSPALAAALSAEPAFAVPSSVRRPSTSERRLRTLSGLSSGQPSPPVSPAAATLELPEAGTNAPRSASGAFSTSATGPSITTRTTSGFSGSMAGNMGPPSPQPRPSVSFSSSSPSPLAQQMSMQGSRSAGGQGLAPSASQSVSSSFRSVPGSSLRSSMSGTGVLATLSLRNVFQNYVPRSQNVSAASIARTPPTSTSVFAQGSYSPSNLGTGPRNFSVRRNSSTSDAGSGFAFATSITASSAAAKPQLIKRYSTNFSYRQNRERSGIYGSSLGSEGFGSVGAGAELSSYPRSGGGGSLSSAYGRSWVSRMEQRQGLGTGGAFARTSSLDDATAAATASSASRLRSNPGANVSQTGGLTPSPRSHDEDMDDLVRLLETRPAFGASSMGKLTSSRNERRNAPGLSSTPEEGGGAGGRAGPASDALTESVQSNPGQDRPSSLSGSGLRSGAVLRTANPMSRSQLDELLSRMAESVGILGSKETSSSASGETSSDIAASNDTRHRASPSTGPASSRPLASQNDQSSQPLTAAQIAATLGKGRGSAGKEADLVTDTPISRVSNPGTISRTVSGDAGLRSRSVVPQQVRAYGTSTMRAASASGLAADQGSRLSLDPAEVTSTQSVVPNAVDSNQMPEYEAEGDLMFRVDGQADYDPEDELPGEMEMVADEVTSTGTAVRPADAVTSTFGGGVEAGMGATLPVGAHREGRTHDWHAADRWERERALEAERRRADAEMSRNFGQEVGASTRGRGSHSPWRTTTHSPAQQHQAAAAAVPMSLQSQSTAGAVGFRSSSTRPLTGTANRLMGVSGGGGGAFSDGGKRGYGLSAPSTQQFHYPSHGGRGGANSYPVSRDEIFDDDEEGADE